MAILIDLVHYGVQLMVWLIIIRVFLSYIPHNPYHPILKFIYEMTQPLLNAVGRFMPMSLQAPINFTPLVALLGLQYLIRPLLMALVGAIIGL